MPARHPARPAAWLLTDERIDGELWAVLRKLPQGSGIVVRHGSLSPRVRARMMLRVRTVAKLRGITLLDEQRSRIARVHSAKELGKALLRDPQLLFLSPLFPTRTHPDWTPLPRMKAAVLARLSPRPIHALGGMDRRRFARVRRLGFAGYGAIDGWLRT